MAREGARPRRAIIGGGLSVASGGVLLAISSVVPGPASEQWGPSVPRLVCGFGGVTQLIGGAIVLVAGLAGAAHHD